LNHSGELEFENYSNKERERSKGVMAHDIELIEPTLYDEIQKSGSEVGRSYRKYNTWFNEAGNIAYSMYERKEFNQFGDNYIKIKVETIVKIDSLIKLNSQDYEKLKNKKQNSDFIPEVINWIKWIVSFPVLGKLRLEIYKLEKEKSDAITELGKELYIEHKIGIPIPQAISDVWQRINGV